MPITKVLARGTIFEIQVALQWIQIRGINSFSISPTTNRADTTDFDDEGRLAHMVASRGFQLTLDGFRMEDESGGDRDPGQAAVEALADEIGPSSLAPFRITSPGGEVTEFQGSAQVVPQGGGNDDASTWQAVIESSGAVNVT